MLKPTLFRRCQDSPEIKPAKEHETKEKRDQTRIRPTRNLTPPLAPIPKIERISPAAPNTNNPLNSPKDSKDPAWMQSLTARK